VCRAELRRLSQEYPPYEGRVQILAIAIDPTEPLSELRTVAQQESYPFLVGRNNPEMVSSYQVLIRSTKIVIDKHGVITNRWGYDVEPLGDWSRLFASLADS
jgi:peroxiredoxin